MAGQQTVALAMEVEAPGEVDDKREVGRHLGRERRQEQDERHQGASAEGQSPPVVAPPPADQ